MSLRDEIFANFLDDDGLVSPNPCARTTRNASNNGVCYSGEYVTLLALTGKLTPSDQLHYNIVISACEIKPGLLCRSPANNRDNNSVDDYYGTCSGLYFTRYTEFASDILSHGFHNLGCYNNVNPGVFQWSQMLFRQPQLVRMMFWAAGYDNLFWKLLLSPLTFITAVIIATSCMGLTKNAGADSWRLSWLLIQVAKRESWMCRLASKFWFKRLDSVWGSMCDVAQTYYHGLPGQEHPFVASFVQIEIGKVNK